MNKEYRNSEKSRRNYALRHFRNENDEFSRERIPGRNRHEEGDMDDFHTRVYNFRDPDYYRPNKSEEAIRRDRAHEEQREPSSRRMTHQAAPPHHRERRYTHHEKQSSPKHDLEHRTSSKHDTQRWPSLRSDEQDVASERKVRETANVFKDYKSPRRRKSNKEFDEDKHVTKKKSSVDFAATKIQAAVRGHQTRKELWRERAMALDRASKQRSVDNTTQHHQNSYPSITSIVDYNGASSLALNADPNVGLAKPMQSLDSAQKNRIIRDLKLKDKISDDIPKRSHLQSDTSPAILTLGGINPFQTDDYIAGGTMFLYDIQRSRWYYGGTMPEPRNYHKAVYLNGRVFVTGGYSPLQVFKGDMVATNSMFQLTVKSKRWRRRADMHQARACHGMCIVEENIMVAGGRDNNGKLLSTAEVYYPKRDQWVLQKNMPEAIMGMSCAVLDNCFWVIGGIVAEGSKYSVSQKCYSFDIQQQSWFHKSSLPEPRAFTSSATLKREIWIWCGAKDELSGDGSLESTNTVFLYNPEVGQWEEHSSIVTAKHGVAAAKCGRRVFLIGGISNVAGSKEVLNEHDFYNRENDQYTESAPLPYPLTGSAAVPLPIDYISSSDPKWNLENLDESILNKAATKIQAVYRGFRTRSSLLRQHFPVHTAESMMQKSAAQYRHHAESFGNRWRLFQRVQIDEWPPLPDPKRLPSELNVRLGTLPKGYTVTESYDTGLTKVRRYVQLPEHADPNLSVCGHISNISKKTTKIVGLRKVEHMPAFTRDMLTVASLQDDSFPTILVIGGLQPKEPINLNYGRLIMRYHPLKNRWEYFGVLPEPRNYHACVYYKEFVYVTGGCDPDKRNSGEMVSTNTVYCLSIHSSEWIEKANMNCCRSHHSLVAYQNRLYAIGGRDHNGRLVASIETYDIAEDKWIIKHAMNTSRMGMACVVYDDSIWCLGGMGLSEDDESVSYPVLSSIIAYDVANDSWEKRGNLRCPRAFGTCIVVKNEMWLFGGASKDPECISLISMASVDKFLAEEYHWIRRTLLNTPRHCAAVAAVESCVYIFGGMSSQEWCALSKNEMIVLDDVSIHTVAELPVPLTGLTAVSVPPLSPSMRAESVALLLHAQLTF